MQYNDFLKLYKKIAEGDNVALFNIAKSPRSMLVAGIDRTMLIVCATKIDADSYIAELKDICGDKIIYLPAKAEVLIHGLAMGENQLQYLSCLNDIVSRKAKIIVTTVEAILHIFPNKKLFCDAKFALKVGEDINFEVLNKKLVACGYSRVEKCESFGQYAIRGDIVDIMPGSSAYRIDFFGDTIENIKSIDVTTFLSDGEIQSLEIFPICEILEDIDSAVLKSNTPKSPSLGLEIIIDEIELTSRSNCQGALALSRYSDIFDYLENDVLVVFDEYVKSYNLANHIYNEFVARYTSLFSGGEVFKGQIRSVKPLIELIKTSLQERQVLVLSIMSTSLNDLKIDAIESIKVTPISSYTKDNSLLKKDVENWLKNKYRIAICAKDLETATTLQRHLSKDFIACNICNDYTDVRDCSIVPKYYEKGFILHDEKLVVIGTKDILLKSSSNLTLPKRKKTDVFLAPQIGDYVVHDVHGIGKLVGIESITNNNITKDYCKIEYSGNDRLYLPVEQLDSLVRFAGSDREPKLNKIGGKDFAAVVERVKTSLKEMSFDLKELYKKREVKKGYIYEADSILQKEFEESFPFEETVDQLTVIKEVKADMTSSKVMDRLICGDVGYGKTEVALRAAFKAVENGKQVCFMAPTTILSSQHFNTCQKRFKEFGIRVDFLNRFKNKKQQEEVLRKLSEGRIDVLCGTHRLLSRDVKFSDLGLLILDEEQRFGVEHKEKIKTLREEIDVISLSATPIPRTLHMSLTGIRDISVIETPPTSRLPVQTFVTEQSDALIRDGILKELNRGGQVFVLYNKVASIDTFTAKISNLVPEANIVVAHGQMESSKLELAIEKFYNGEANVLVSSTIIENGIDIPNANTMFIIDSDRLGLSQLYQLKGRVGRSDRLAFVYFMYQQNKVLSDNAYKRLSAIMEFTEFGSGFKIAMRDLEIRGAGNVLGREQHGHMEQVGYDMYCKLLREVVRDETEEKIDVEVELEVNVSAYISDKYVGSSNSRMEIYKSIARIKNMEDMLGEISRIENVYGTLEERCYNLIYLSYIRVTLKKIFAKKLTINDKEFFLTLTLSSLKNELLLKYINDKNNHATLIPDKEIKLVFNRLNKKSHITHMFDFLAKLEIE